VVSDEARRVLLSELSERVPDERVLAAIAAVPRERFVPARLQAHAYDNVALAIDCGQTISQPLVVARMAQLLDLRPQDRVLDVGTGSGYHAAVLAQLAAHVWSIERHRRLAEQAVRALEEAGVANVTVLVGDGTQGVPGEEPFDAVNVAAAASPEALEALAAKLAPGGRLVAPLSGRRQRLVTLRRDRRGLRRDEHEEVRFVPLISDRPDGDG
jgi:protein-L-isoaspartate(D-aspartate) O-methyltransferase